MSPEIRLALEDIQIEGDVGIKRTFTEPNNRVTLCVRPQDVSAELENQVGQEIFGISGDDEGIVVERGSGRKSNNKSDLLLVPSSDERFFLKGIEESSGNE